MSTRPTTTSWIACAVAIQLALAAIILLALGAGEHGTDAALQATARLAFLLFWPAYAASALVSLFGPPFAPLKRHGRELGLAFTAALGIHLCLVAWLCRIGHTPSVQTFLIFGAGVACAALLALFSIARLQKMLHPTAWWLLRTVAMNYLAFAFALDFLHHPLHGGIRHVIEYLPFATLAIAGPMLRLSSLGMQELAIRQPGQGRGTRIAITSQTARDRAPTGLSGR